MKYVLNQVTYNAPVFGLTAASGTKTTQLATCAFVLANAGNSIWGNIGGVLSDQLDLQSSLDSKALANTPYITYTITLDAPAVSTQSVFQMQNGSSNVASWVADGTLNTFVFTCFGSPNHTITYTNSGQDSLSGAATPNRFSLGAPAGQEAVYEWRTGTSLRWRMAKLLGAETGANLGSGFQFASYDDSGALISSVFQCVRSTGQLLFTLTPTAPTATAGDNSTKVATTAYARQAAPNASYRTLLDCTASHTAARAIGVYGLGQGDPAALTGVGTLYPLNTIYIDAADYPTVDGLAAKLRIRAQLYTNDVAPTGTYTFGLYPITRPATSGAAGLAIYTLGTVVTGSNGAAFTSPAADGLLSAVSADFALPATGHYVLGFSQTVAAVAASAHIHISASLQLRNN